VGTYPITGTLADPGAKLGNYSVASNNGTLTVNPAALTVTAADGTRVYGDINPAFTGSIVGLKNGDTITATFTSAATAGSAVGAYSITPSLADPGAKLGNYTATSNNGALTIAAASLTVNAGNSNRAYGDPNPAFAGTIVGLKNGDVITATYASVATATSPVGTYPVSPALVDPTGKLGNYIVTLNNGTMTVAPALLTVTATNTTRLYGDPNPSLTGIIAGLKNGDPITATFASVSTPGSPVGTFAIVPTLVDLTAKLGNYSVSTFNGTLTVGPAALTVTAANASRIYGAANPVFSGTITGLKNADAITATFASVATPGSPVGTFTIVTTLADPAAKLGNYSVSLNNGTLTISPASLTVTAANASRAFGATNPALSGTIAGLKNGDIVTATFSTAATAASPAGTYPIVPALVDAAGKLVNYSVTTNNGTLTVIGIPATVSVSPSTGAATNAVFSAVYTDASGSAGIGDARLLISNAISFVSSCGVRYTQATNQLFLMNDAGAVWQGPITPGAVGTLQNSQCVLDGATSSVVAAGNNVTVNFSIRFLPAFTGNSNIYLQALDTKNNLNSGWKQLGTWSLAIATPAAVSVSPSAGTAISAVFKAVYSDASGSARVGDARLLINNAISFVGSCGVRYTQATNQLFLMNDAGAVWQGPITPGAVGTLQNSQCVLDGATSSVVAAGNNLTVNFSVRSLPAFIGNKNIYMEAIDTKTNLISGWKQLGTWTLPVPTPVNVSVTPNAGTATSQIFSAVYSDTAGAVRITDARLLINNAVSFVGSCAVRYTQATNQLFLMNDAGTVWQGPITAGAAGTLQNSQCVLNGATSSVTAAGNNLTVNTSFSFKPTFIAAKNQYLQAYDVANHVNSAWSQVGTWTLPVPTPINVSVTPNAGTATSQIFSAVYSDPAGASRIGDARLLIGGVLNFPHACGVRYVQATNQLFLMNDVGTVWLGPITPGSAGTLSNTQCVLNGATSSVTAAGNNLTVNFSVNFLAFAGSKNLYMQAFDTANKVNSAWSIMGAWTLP
jgi:hypothetical protein